MHPGQGSRVALHQEVSRPPKHNLGWFGTNHWDCQLSLWSRTAHIAGSLPLAEVVVYVYTVAFESRMPAAVYMRALAAKGTPCLNRSCEG